MKNTLIAISLLGACTALTACAPDEPRMPMHDPMRHAEMKADHKMEKFDTNHDGYISRAEWAAGMKRKFSMIDTNHDGLISRQELIDAEAREHERWKRHEAPRKDWQHDAWNDTETGSNSVSEGAAYDRGGNTGTPHTDLPSDNYNR